MPRIASKRQARYLVSAGPFGIGEDHTQPAARDFVSERIEDGVVKQLFVELPTTNQFQIDLMATEVKKANPDWRYVRALGTAMMFLGFRNAHPLWELISQALAADIPVWASDHPRMGNNFRIRHQRVQSTYLAKTVKTGTTGCLLLWGSHHFTDPQHGLDQYIPGLRYFNF